MGEMADWALEMNVYPVDEAGFDGFDRVMYDEEEGGVYVPCKPPLKCRYCKSTDVYWDNTVNGWRLFNVKNQQLHNCR